MSDQGFTVDSGFFTSLVDPADFTEDEQHLTQWLVSQIRFGAKMRQGLMVEAHLARLLGAQLPTLGNTPWDLRLSDGRLVEVKSFGIKGPVNVNQSSKEVDIWIFVDKGPAADLHEARYYTMTPRQMTAAFGSKKTSSIRKFEQAAGPSIGAADLVASIKRSRSNDLL